MTERLPQPEFPAHYHNLPNYSATVTKQWWEQWIGSVVVPHDRNTGNTGRAGILKSVQHSGSEESYISVLITNTRGVVEGYDYDLYKLLIVMDQKGRLYEENPGD